MELNPDTEPKKNTSESFCKNLAVLAKAENVIEWHNFMFWVAFIGKQRYLCLTTQQNTSCCLN